MIDIVRLVTLTEDEVVAAVGMGDAIDAVRQAFCDFATGDFDLREPTDMGNGRFVTRSAYHRPSATSIVKHLSVNFARRPALAGVVVWTESERTDTLVADAGAVTALRTGAVVGVATDLLAPKGASRLVQIGAGAQSRQQVLAVNTVRPLDHITVVDADVDRATQLANELAASLPGATVTSATEASAALDGCDIVCCATNAASPVIRVDTLSDTVHVNAIGAYKPSMRELPDELLADALVVVDQREACLAESGEVIHAIAAGVLNADQLVELGTALHGAPPSAQRTVFKSVGLAIQDWAIANLLARQYLQQM